MHFAMPPRKTSRPPPYAVARMNRRPPWRARLRSLGRRERLVAGALVVGVLVVLWLARGALRLGYGTVTASGAGVGDGAGGARAPPVVIVTTFDPAADPQWVERVKQNRNTYAARHGYAAFFPDEAAYDLGGAPRSWAKVPALRHAMTAFPGATWFWALDSNALIMNGAVAVGTAVAAPARLEALLLADVPVVPPDSVIRTFARLAGARIDLVLTQDADGLGLSSFLVRRGDWARFLLDLWFDPIYRAYNFQKAEAHALEHIVQWHGTVLAKLALVPQDALNAYVTGPAAVLRGQYNEGDLVATFACGRDGRADCPEQMGPFLDVLASHPGGVEATARRAPA